MENRAATSGVQAIAIPITAPICDNQCMTEQQKPISIAEAIAPGPGPEPGPTEDVRAWQMRKIQDRQIAADEGRFASDEAVRMVIRKYIAHE